MVFNSASQLFTQRDSRMGDSDIQYVVEHFLQQELRSEKIHCRVSGTSRKIAIRVGSAALAEAVLIREKEIRAYVQSLLECSLGGIRVMLDV